MSGSCPPKERALFSPARGWAEPITAQSLLLLSWEPSPALVPLRMLLPTSPRFTNADGDPEGLSNSPTTTGLGEWPGQAHTDVVCRRAGGAVWVLKALTVRPTRPFASLSSPLSTCLTVSQELAILRVDATLIPFHGLHVCVDTHSHPPQHTSLSPYPPLYPQTSKMRRCKKSPLFHKKTLPSVVTWLSYNYETFQKGVPCLKVLCI